MLAAPQATTTTSAANRSSRAVPLDDHLGDGRALAVRLEPDDLRVRHERHVRVLERRPHAEHLGVGLRVDEAREAVAGRAADAGAVRRVRLVEHDPARRVERPVAGCREVVGELLDPRLVRHGRDAGRARSPAARSGPRPGRRARGRAAPRACSTAPARRRRSARPARCRRDAAARRSPPCAAGTAPRRRASSRLRRSSGPPAGRACRSRRTTCPARRSGCRRTRPVRPVLRLAREPVAALEQEDPLARGGKVARERAAARAGPDDDRRRRCSVMLSLSPALGDDDSARPPRSARGGRTPAGSCRGGARSRRRTPPRRGRAAKRSAAAAPSGRVPAVSRRRSRARRRARTSR